MDGTRKDIRIMCRIPHHLGSAVLKNVPNSPNLQLVAKSLLLFLGGGALFKKARCTRRENHLISQLAPSQTIIFSLRTFYIHKVTQVSCITACTGQLSPNGCWLSSDEANYHFISHCFVRNKSGKTTAAFWEPFSVQCT